MERLAIAGGRPAVPRSQRRVDWPVVSPADRDAVLRVLDTGKFTCMARGEQEIRGFEEEWARFVDVKHCVAVSNGTAALTLALAALGVEPGDEVLVPALSFIATAIAPLHQLAIPVFVDIDPRTFTIDACQLESRITLRTRAILVVHLHGLPADLDAIRAVAERHGLFVIEDAAQAHGAVYRGRQVGSIGHVGAFSLNPSKNLPTCGEGGMVTTNDTALGMRMMMLRQFGEMVVDGEERSYLHGVLGWNEKLSAIQAAFARSQLAQFSEYQVARDRNVRHFLEALAELPGIQLPLVPEDRTHVWHILRLRFDPVGAGLDGVNAGAFRRALQRVLVGEGVPVTEYQKLPLPAQELFQTQRGYGRGYPWALGNPPYQYRGEDYPVTRAVIEDSLTVQRAHLNPTSVPLLDLYAEAFHKTWRHLDVVARLARAIEAGAAAAPTVRK